MDDLITGDNLCDAEILLSLSGVPKRGRPKGNRQFYGLCNIISYNL